MPRRRRRQPVIINETRDNYYLRCSIDSEITLVAAENEALENLSVDNVKTDYAPGEAPRATATTSADDTTNALMVEAAATKPATGNLAATGDDAALMCLCQAGNEQSGTRNLSSLADGLVKRSPSRASAPHPCGGSIPRTR